MPFIIDPNIKTVFIVPPKNGCSTARIEIGKIMFPDVAKKMTRFDNNFFDKYNDSIAEKFINNSELSTFKIIIVYRNIYDRFFSFCDNVLYQRSILDPEKFSLGW